MFGIDFWRGVAVTLLVEAVALIVAKEWLVAKIKKLKETEGIA